MSTLTDEQIDKMIKVVADKNVRWAQAKGYGTSGGIPAGWTVKNEPGELATFTKKLIEENKLLKDKIEQLEGKQNVNI